MLWLPINNLPGLTIESLLLGWSFRVVSHSTEASKNFTNTIWTKGQLQGFLRTSLSWNSFVVITLPLVCNLIEKEVYCRRVPLNNLNFMNTPKRADWETIFFFLYHGQMGLFVQPINYAGKTLDVIMLSLKMLLSYVINNTETFVKLFVLGTFKI